MVALKLSGIFVFGMILAVQGAVVGVESARAAQPTSLVADGSGGFGSTCSSIRLSGTTLSAVCTSETGVGISSSINLDSCVANDNEVLACQANGGYGGSCSKCELDGTVMGCTCGGGGFQRSIDLNGCIGNLNGILVC